MDGEHDEADDADGPGESDAGEELLDDGWEDDAAGGAAGGCDADGQGSFRGEVGGEEGESWAEDEAVSEAGADSLGEEQLPVFGADGCHEDTDQL